MASSSTATQILSFSSDKHHSDMESKKTIAQGRRLPKAGCVENPTHQEIRDILVAAGLKVGVENKLYSRERSKELLYRGRIRVQLKNDDGSPVDPKFPTRESIMAHACEMIPKLKSRQTKFTSDQTQTSTTAGKGKNKGKGRR